MKHLSSLEKLAPKSIVRIHDVSGDSLSFSMQYLPGGDLERIRLHGWGSAKKLGIFVQVAEAVQFSHSQGIVHRDIKPANVVLDVGNDAVLTDFDIADLNFAKTQSVYAASLGTPQFAAPEQLIAEILEAHPTADVYSLGKLLYFLFEESPPPLGSTEPGHMPSYLTRITDDRVRTTIHRAISYRPENRFQSVAEMIASVRGN